MTSYDLKPGMTIFAKRTLYRHFGIFAGWTSSGQPQVIHYVKLDGSCFDGIVQRTDFAAFTQGDEWGVKFYSGINYNDPDTLRKILARAEAKIGTANYKPFTQNCEHFCSECTTGDPKSEQVQKLVVGLVVVAVAIFFPPARFLRFV